MTKKKLLILSMALLLGSGSSLAEPAYPVKRVITLDENTQLTVTLRGDEYFHYYEAGDGRLFRERLDGSFQEMSALEVEDCWKERKSVMGARRSQRVSARRSIGEPKQVLTGTKRGLVILAEFSDLPFTTANPNAVFKNFFNQIGYKDYGMTGSVRDYFLAQSYGKFDLQFDVVGPVKLPGTMAYYGAPTEYSNDVHPALMAYDACKAAADSANFALYDWDGDREVDQVFIIYPGYGQSHGAPANTIWPHEWALAGEGLELTLNGMKVDTYACSCELSGTRGSNLNGIGTACHEFTHCLGLPDMYDTGSGNNYGMGFWDLMNSGNYNNDCRTPAGFTAYERWFAGWLTPVELKEMTRVENMQPLQTAPEAYILYNEGNRNEFYLLENRQQIEWDAAIGGHGLLVVHVDYDKELWFTNSLNQNANHQCMTIIPADGVASTRTESGDPFPGTRNVTELTNYSAVAATTYNANVDGKKLMSKPLDNITENKANHTVSFVACRPELGIPQPGDGVRVENETAFTVSWPAIEGAVAYEMSLTEMGTASDDPKEALEREFDFSGMISKTVGYSDVSTKLSSYGLSNWAGNKLFTTPNKMRIGTSTSTGYVRTPTWNVPQSSDVTIVMGANVVKAGSPVSGVISVAYGNQGDQATYESQNFTVNGEEQLVFSFNIRKDLFWIEIRPDAQMYLNYLAIYDGTWTAEQLGIGGGASARSASSPRKATTVTSYSTDTNSITLTNLNQRSRYIYKVRALGQENTYSQWSGEKSFAFDGTGISTIQLSDQQAGAVFDLQGRKVTSPQKNGIYIRNGRKVVF